MYERAPRALSPARGPHTPRPTSHERAPHPTHATPARRKQASDGATRTRPSSRIPHPAPCTSPFAHPAPHPHPATSAHPHPLNRARVRERRSAPCVPSPSSSRTVLRPTAVQRHRIYRVEAERAPARARYRRTHGYYSRNRHEVKYSTAGQRSRDRYSSARRGCALRLGASIHSRGGKSSVEQGRDSIAVSRFDSGLQYDAIHVLDWRQEHL
ncbi:hypothetical protein DFH08DRAFT_840887 [Mycena albidolilacea]|uniref:Uncharacterized protein n=1 Tax=Mycena albidolilacea TaxID=1033008 RepID=A0AAD7ALQ2_9AGAR|nr:hypothetical protein DFH08DRAFT_840887 [Mycena albidolilacea]